MFLYDLQRVVVGEIPASFTPDNPSAAPNRTDSPAEFASAGLHQDSRSGHLRRDLSPTRRWLHVPEPKPPKNAVEWTRQQLSDHIGGGGVERERISMIGTFSAKTVGHLQ